MKKNVLVRLSRFLRPYGFRFLLLLVLLLAGNLLSLAAPCSPVGRWTPWASGREAWTFPAWFGTAPGCWAAMPCPLS